jgi:hypothetical protein
MACKDQRRLAVVPDLVEQFDGPFRQFDTAVFRMVAIVVPDVVEMGEFGADAAEIVPHAGEDRFDLLGRFFREGGLEILAADAVLAQSSANQLRDAAEHPRGLEGIEIARRAQKRDRGRAHRRLGQRLGGVAKARLGAKEQAVHRDARLSAIPVRASGSARHSARRNRTSWTSRR